MQLHDCFRLTALRLFHAGELMTKYTKMRNQRGRSVRFERLQFVCSKYDRYDFAVRSNVTQWRCSRRQIQRGVKDVDVNAEVDPVAEDPKTIGGPDCATSASAPEARCVFRARATKLVSQSWQDVDEAA